MNILLINGSLAKESHTNALLHFMKTVLETTGCTVELISFHQLPLPIALPEYHHHPETFPNSHVQQLLQLVQRADAFVIGSPLYHGSYSGVLKNALDHLPYDAFRNKPVALATNGGGVRAGLAACDHLRCVVRALFGYSTQGQVATSTEDYSVVDGCLTLTNESIQLRSVRLMQELMYLARCLHGTT